MASAWGLSWGMSWGNSWGLLSPTPSPDTKHGGDDAFHHLKHTGWNKEAWKKKHLRENAIEATIRATYEKILGISPSPKVIEEIRKESITEKITIDVEKEFEFINWLHAQIEKEIEDEEEELLLMIGF